MSARKRAVTGNVVKLLTHQQLDRGMTLMPFESRCLLRGEIHELVTTDERDAVAGDRIDRVGFLGFVEIASGGVVERGDAMRLDERLLGEVLGFDDCHAPNHLNVIVATDRLTTGVSAPLTVEDEIRFEAASLTLGASGSDDLGERRGDSLGDGDLG